MTNAHKTLSVFVVHELKQHHFRSREIKMAEYLKQNIEVIKDYVQKILDLRVSRPPLYPLSYRVNGDWWRVLSNLSERLSWRTRSVSILTLQSPTKNSLARAGFELTPSGF